MAAVELIVLVGIQASGKTTYYRRQLAGQCLHISLDNWRGKGNVRHKEHEAIRAGLRQADAGASRGVVVDNTNTAAAGRKRYFDYAEEFRRETGREVRVTACFFDADLASCQRRNAQRPADAPPGEPYFVPPEVIAAYRRRLQPPRYAEGFEKIFRVCFGENDEFVVSEVPRGSVI